MYDPWVELANIIPDDIKHLREAQSYCSWLGDDIFEYYPLFMEA